jgi:G:T-mismatch repair DNA endonuclease (very short patch repair protein)
LQSREKAILQSLHEEASQYSPSHKDLFPGSCDEVLDESNLPAAVTGAFYRPRAQLHTMSTPEVTTSQWAGHETANLRVGTNVQCIQLLGIGRVAKNPAYGRVHGQFTRDNTEL